MNILYFLLNILRIAGFVCALLLLSLIAWSIISLFYNLYLVVLFRLSKFTTGDPEIARPYWNVQSGRTCAINVQRIILDMFGIHKDGNDLSGRQKAFGKYEESSGSDSVTFLLDGYGIKTKKRLLNEHSVKRCLFELWKLLRKGKVIISTVNTHQLNIPDSSFVPNEIPRGDHTVLITAMEKDNNGDMNVWYTDTGNEIGIQRKISGRDFIFASNRVFYETPKVPGLTASGFKAEVFMGLLVISCFMLIAAYNLYRWMFN